MGLTAESRCHPFAEVGYRQSVAAYVHIGCYLPFQVACSLQFYVARIANVGHQVYLAIVRILVIIVQLDKVDIQLVGEQLLHGWHLGVLAHATCYAHKRRLAEERELRQCVACIGSRVEINLAVHGVLAG